MSEHHNHIPLACDLTAIDEAGRARHAEVFAAMQAAVQHIEPLPNGYALRFAPASDRLLLLAEFVSRERLCCPFFHFEIALEPGDGPLWLRLTGAEGVKDFLRSELGLA